MRAERLVTEISDAERLLEVLAAVKQGNFEVRMPSGWTGISGKVADTLNDIIQLISENSHEIERLSQTVGKEGRLSQRGALPAAAGAWRRRLEAVNGLIDDLVRPTREMARVIGAVANGDLTQTVALEADGEPLRGEFLTTATTVNAMVQQLDRFAGEVTRVAREVGTEGKLGGQANVPGAAGTWKDLTDNVNLLAANLTTQVRAIADVATAVTKGDLTRSIQVEARGEVAELKDNINAMIENLRVTTEQNTEQDWLKTNLARFTSMMQGQRDLVTVGRMLLSELAPLVNAQYGAIYQMAGDNGSQALVTLASYAGAGGDGGGVRAGMPLGAGLIGQCAIEKKSIVIREVPPDYVRVRSGLGDAAPRSLIILPVLFEGQTKAVIELASLAEFTSMHLTFLAQLTESIGIVLNTIEATMRTEGLLQQSQKLASELQTQQSELQQTNEELANKAQQLAEQNAEVERKNREIEQARYALEEKAAELALASKYKSEFLANMSHELRTPLNSVLILAQQLSENSDGNLTLKQVEFARNIHAAGADLLNLISDILDLSKIESGTVTLEPENVSFLKLHDAAERSFRHVADARNLAFAVQMDPDLPSAMTTDVKRLQQILKNLLSNAFKFTSHGHVTLRLRRAQGGWSSDHVVLNRAASVIAFEVSDTGIGIQPDKQKTIFEAFHQGDAGTSRRYGGTGLGLAISRELANLLGGEIRLISMTGVGSTFTLFLPDGYFSSGVAAAVTAKTPSVSPAPLIVQQAVRPEEVPDDRESVDPDDSVVLIVEDDPHYGRVLVGLARSKGFKAIVTAKGAAVRALARQYHTVAIMLDIFLPDMLGCTVLSLLKQDPATRHIPVQIITVEEERMQGLGHGAFSYLIKPAASDELERTFDRVVEYARAPNRRLLVVEDNELECQGIVDLLGHDSVEITTASTGADAWQALTSQSFDCVVLDLRLPDISGFDLLEKIRLETELRDLPIVVFTGKELTDADELQLRKLAESIVLKGVESPERLLDETSLFLHLAIEKLPAQKQKMLERLRQSDEALIGKKVLVVDDDVRNIFALTSLLERHGMRVLSAETGREAIDLINRESDIDAVLMDIMMPEMDGYETVGAIRENPRHRLLPILALTAKAMKGDREKCLEAGASDYIAKPVNAEELLALLRIWLFGKQKLVFRQIEDR